MSASKDVLGSALVEIAGPLKDLADKLGGENGPKWLEALKRFLRKEEAWPRYLIDLDSDPMVPEGWEVEEHRKGGQFEFDPTKVVLYLDQGQKDGRVIKGHELRKKLATQPVFNANLLDFYLAHPNLIPEEWKGKAVFFWGTIYRDSDGLLCVRYLVWDGSEWGWHCSWLGIGWDGDDPAASRVTSPLDSGT